VTPAQRDQAVPQQEVQRIAECLQHLMRQRAVQSIGWRRRSLPGALGARSRDWRIGRMIAGPWLGSFVGKDLEQERYMWEVLSGMLVYYEIDQREEPT